MIRTFSLFVAAMLWWASMLHAQTIAVTEVQNSLRPGPKQNDAFPSRVLFYSLPTGKPVGSVETVEYPSVTRAPDGDHFLIASINIPQWAAGDKKTVISEFDPQAKKVIDTYQHPRSIGGGASPLSFGVSESPSSMQCTGGLVWLSTRDYGAKGEPGNGYIEGINWKTKKVVATLEQPAAQEEISADFFAMGDHCVVIRYHQHDRSNHKTDAIVIWEGGKSEPVILPLPADQWLTHVAVGKSELVAQVGTAPILLRIGLDSVKHRLLINDPVNAPQLREGGRYVAQLVYLNDLGLIVAAQTEGQGIDRVVLIDATTLKPRKAVELSRLIEGLRFEGGTLYGYAPLTSTIVEYDKNFKVRHESQIGWRIIGFTTQP
ncbi:MAG TPA: hypothetical protein VIL86_04455 [Tepidisphaeraceae bacterium]|jgi:hypothetical protein